MRKLIEASLQRESPACQDGSKTNAPYCVFADADYESGDGSCGLHETPKSANEPAIVYVRADWYLKACRERDKFRSVLEGAGYRDIDKIADEKMSVLGQEVAKTDTNRNK